MKKKQWRDLDTDDKVFIVGLIVLFGPIVIWMWTGVMAHLWSLLG